MNRYISTGEGHDACARLAVAIERLKAERSLPPFGLLANGQFLVVEIRPDRSTTGSSVVSIEPSSLLAGNL